MNEIQELKKRQFEIILEEEEVRDKIKELQNEIAKLEKESWIVIKQIKEIEATDELISFEESVRYKSIINKSTIKSNKAWKLNSYDGSVELVRMIEGDNLYPAIRKRELKELI